MRPVLVCPNCKHIFVNRKRGNCSRCGQGIARNKEFWGKDQVWMDGKETITYQEGLKRIKE